MINDIIGLLVGLVIILAVVIITATVDYTRRDEDIEKLLHRGEHEKKTDSSR